MSPSLHATIVDAEVEGRRTDVVIEEGRIAALAPPGGGRGEGFEAHGGALLPGLHDHHVHLLALAASLSSVACGPPDVESEAHLRERLHRARPERGWLRGVGYHESVAGVLDREKLDALGPTHPVRVQDRSGAVWSLNSAAIRALELEGEAPSPGIERDAAGRPTGRLFRMDEWLRLRLERDLGAAARPALEPVGEALARYGVTGVTDAGVHNDAAVARLLGEAQARGALPQRLLVLGKLDDPPRATGRLGAGAVKLILDDARLPGLAELAQAIGSAHAAGRAVAIHAVTRAELFLALAALEETGLRAGDRIEHANVAPPEAVERVRALGLRVVGQPILIHDRGDRYLRDVEAQDQPWLLRGRGWVEAGVPLAAGSDAPYGSPDPWLSMRSACTRRTRAGQTLAPEEGLTPEEALALHLAPLEDPGGRPRRVEVGAPADLCLLDRPWHAAREDLHAGLVRATWCAGHRVWQASARFG